VRLSPHQKVLLESVYSKEEKQPPTEVYRESNNIMRLNGREQVSHKTLSELVADLELYRYVEVEQKGRGRGVAVISTSLRRAQSNERRYWMRRKI